MCEHLLEMAKALVKVKNGQIHVMTDPLIHRCPLRADLYGCEEESRQTIEQVLRDHIEELGMYGPGRVLESDKKPVSFGASEIVTDAMVEGLLDAAVVVCEGAGTVVVTRPEVLQAVGAHMTGLIRTEPIQEIKRGLEERGCILLDGECTIDQVKGYIEAVKSGFERVVVTIAGHEAMEAEQIRAMEQATGARPAIFAVHTTGISDADALLLAEYCDVVWGCASRSVREVVGKRSRLQMGVSIPVFAVTELGKRLVLNRALYFDDSLVFYRACLPHAPAEKQPSPLI